MGRSNQCRGQTIESASLLELTEPIFVCHVALQIQSILHSRRCTHIRVRNSFHNN